MKKVIFKEESNTIEYGNINATKPIFAKDKESGELKGMVIKEEGQGYITRTSLVAGCSGYHNTLKKCIMNDMEYYDFYAE